MRSIPLIPNAATILLLSLWIPNNYFAGGGEQQLCNVGADYFPRQPRQLSEFPTGDACLLLDVYMPGMTGIDLCRTLAKSGR